MINERTLAKMLAKPVCLRAVRRRYAALHEAAHFIIAQSFGMNFISCRIWWDEDESDFEGGFTCPTYQFVRLSRFKQMKIGIAGLMGEIIWDYRFEGNRISVNEALNESSLSDTDYELCGCSSRAVAT